MSDAWGELMADPEYRSWEEILTPEDRAGGPSPWGNSKYSYFEQCPHKFDVFFNKRYKSRVPSDALEIGGLFHECRAKAYLRYLELFDSDLSDKDIDLEFERALFDLVDRAQDIVPVTASEVRRLLKGWVITHGPGKPTDDRHETLLVEPLIEVNNGFPYSSRLDRVVWSERFDGPVIMEIKTASRKSSDLLASYTMDSQFLGQQYCWRHSKYYRQYGPLKVFIVDLAIKTAELSFPRESVPVNNAAIRDWEKAKRATYRNMMMCSIDGYWPRIRTNCVKYGQPCGLRHSCSILGKGKNPYPGFRKKEDEEY